MTWRLPAPAAGGIVVSLRHRIPPPLARLGLILGALAVALSCTPSSNAAPAPGSPVPPTPAPPAAATATERSAAPVETSTGARTWFMAPDASCGSGNGTLEKPWCIQDALESRRVKPGDTIEARLGGTYKLREMAGSFVPITATLTGSPDRRITVKPYAPDQTTPTTLIRVACDQPERGQGRRMHVHRVELGGLLRLRGRQLRRSAAPTDHRPVRLGRLRDRRAGFRRRQKEPRRRKSPHQLGRARHRGRRLQVGSGQSDRLLRHGRLQLRVSLQPREGTAHRGPRLLPPQRDRGERPPQELHFAFRSGRQRAGEGLADRQHRLRGDLRQGLRRGVPVVSGLRNLRRA